MVLVRDDAGLACPSGGFWIDAWAPVARCVLTHAHADHARPGCGSYVATPESVPILRRRLGPEAVIEPLAYGERRRFGDVEVSLHPAGHVLGSAQVRVTQGDAVWVVTGDVKRAPDPTCAPFEPVRCDVLVVEATFGLPIYRWPSADAELERLVARWRADGQVVTFAYALGKAQRLLALLAAREDLPGPVLAHGAVRVLVEAYREAGVALPEAPAIDAVDDATRARSLILAPPSARGSPWMRRFPRATTALASGWMRVRGDRRRRAIDLGLVVSDHADWPALESIVRDSGASRVLVTHGMADTFARHLRAQGLEADVLGTAYEGEADGEAATDA